MDISFIELALFDRDRERHISDNVFQLLQTLLRDNPHSGSLIPGSGGLRKIRLADPRRGKGKRGGLRIIYYYFESRFEILLFMIYSKGEIEGLSSEQLKQFSKVLTHYMSD